MKLLRWMLVLLWVTGGVAGCTFVGEKPLKAVKGSEETKEGATYLVGIIEFVNPEQRFVVVKAEPGMILPSGHTLTALDATGALSELVITQERKGQHLTADIKDGQPRAGNLVIYRPKLQTNAEPTQGGEAAMVPPSSAMPLVPGSPAAPPVEGLAAPIVSPPPPGSPAIPASEERIDPVEKAPKLPPVVDES